MAKQPSAKRSSPKIRRPSTTARIISTVEVLIGCQSKDPEARRASLQPYFQDDFAFLQRWVESYKVFGKARKQLRLKKTTTKKRPY